ncbi:hypothetical protein GIB67_039587 [Kingdonia uniflora]|uniref:MATH domain-containing protein n=1 Tax=Kingdonia uniflora TaxID=39325 RepID=A0A7J7P6H1_9MAGN|nr:hypothetical protein GIB67_039587 [Kingdonia uniflora]
MSSSPSTSSQLQPHLQPSPCNNGIDRNIEALLGMAGNDERQISKTKAKQAERMRKMNMKEIYSSYKRLFLHSIMECASFLEEGGMAGSMSEDNGVGGSSSAASADGISSGQRCQSSEALAEWRSSEQVENGTPSTSPPYWDTDDEDDICGPKPSELYGKFTWKIENFSQISKRELRSNAFEVGGYKWYILIYPQGCDVCNHLSLFLCVANHDKLLPGWSHFAQFTIAVVNKDPRKSKYSGRNVVSENVADTLHRFWKKEHDWGWKKFMELSKVLDGFIVADTLVIKAQVQVIREKSHRPFRCLDCQYRRELVRVYLSNVETICRKFVDEKTKMLGELIGDKVMWSSFCAFWLGVDQNARRRMSKENADVILKVVVKQFFIEKEVTSTLVMDSLYSGLKALECQSKGKKGRAKLLDTEQTPSPIVLVDKDMFILCDDVLSLLERAAIEPLPPPKDEKGPQIRTKDGSSGEDFNKDSIERDERRLTELGRRTVEIFVLAHIYNNKIEVAYQEAVALKRQEELIREEEAAGQAESELKARRGAAEKDKKTKKKQSKQRKSSRKGKDKGRDESSDVTVQGNQLDDIDTDGRAMEEDFPLKRVLSVLEKPYIAEDVSDVSFTGEDVVEMLQPDLEYRDVNPLNWDTDTSEVHPPTEVSNSGVSELPVQNGQVEHKSTSVIMDDSSSTCSTDSIPSVVMNGPYKGNSLPKCQTQTSPNRGKNRRGKEKRERTVRASEKDNQSSEPLTDTGHPQDASGTTSKAGGLESQSVLSLKDRIQWLEQHLVDKEEEVVTLQKKLVVKDHVSEERPPKKTEVKASSSPNSSSPNSPIRNVHPKPMAESMTVVKSLPAKGTSSNSTRQTTEKVVPMRTPSPQIPTVVSKPDTCKPTKPTSNLIGVMPIEKNPQPNQISLMSRPSSAPIIPEPRPTAPVVTVTQSAPLLARSVSAAGRLGTDPTPAAHSTAPQSYRNAIMGKGLNMSMSGFTSRPPSSSAINPSPTFSQTPSAYVSSPMISTQNVVRSGFTFGTVVPSIVRNQPQWAENLDFYSASSSSGSRTYFGDDLPASIPLHQTRGMAATTRQPQGTTAPMRQTQGMAADDFPHLDIINFLLDEEQSVKESAYLGPTNIHNHHTLNQQLTFPSDHMSMSADIGPSINSCRFDRFENYHDDGMNHFYSPSSNGPFDGLRRDMGPLVGLSPYTNGLQMDGATVQTQWPLGGSADLSMLAAESDGYNPYQIPGYSNMACVVNGYTMFRPSNEH